ncbi:hypothetical protein WISP_08585 [Willisornis vidua]|uniref:Uncharacterized protein n=1 Tax=Willisornis vidua TaxID=1566151 RepID=A0ABQ9DWN7_9PASS|nr:hypothetical protein WISP_08585 [Willisornis vidua]
MMSSMSCYLSEYLLQHGALWAVGRQPDSPVLSTGCKGVQLSRIEYVQYEVASGVLSQEPILQLLIACPANKNLTGCLTECSYKYLNGQPLLHISCPSKERPQGIGTFPEEGKNPMKDLEHKFCEKWLRDLGMISMEKRRLSGGLSALYCYLKGSSDKVGVDNK